MKTVQFVLYLLLTRSNCFLSQLTNIEKTKRRIKLTKINPSSVTVIGPGASTSDNMDTTTISPSNRASHLSSSEFMDFKDQLSSHFTRLETFLASVGALPSCQPKPVFLPPIRVGVSHPPPWGGLYYSFYFTAYTPYQRTASLLFGLLLLTLSSYIVQPFS